MTVSKASLSKVQYTTPIADIPDGPTIDSVTDVGTSRAFNNGSATVAFTAAATGGTPSSYTVTSSPGSYTGSGASSPITVTGLQSNTNYTFSATSTNSTGTGTAGPSSSSILATTVPDAPTVGTATVTSDTVVSLTFTPPATGGSAITGYTISSSPSIAITTQAGTSSPLTATGTYIAGTEYTFTISAINANGTSNASSASNGVTPKPIVSFTTNYLVVAGGGAGNTTTSGQGGAGGYRTSFSTSGANSSPESALTLNTGTNYAVTVGAGGPAQTVFRYWQGESPALSQTVASANGSNSVFSTITSTGGGKWGATGGSGGGNSGLGTANQGCNGGSGGEGGGGGAGGAGTTGDYNVHHGQWSYGSAGPGLASSITGSSVTRAQGARGAQGHHGYGGCGGGGPAGGANTGGGGSNNAQSAMYGGFGGVPIPGHFSGGAGGSGVVILRYPSERTITVGAGLTGSTTTDGSFKVTTLTAGTGNVIWS